MSIRHRSFLVALTLSPPFCGIGEDVRNTVHVGRGPNDDFMAYERAEHQILSQQGAPRRATEDNDRYALVDRVDMLRNIDRILYIGADQYSVNHFEL